LGKVHQEIVTIMEKGKVGIIALVAVGIGVAIYYLTKVVSPPPPVPPVPPSIKNVKITKVEART